MKKLVAKIFGLYTDADVKIIKTDFFAERKKYYDKVLQELHINGTLPPDCGLKMPKQRVRLERTEEPKKGEVVANNGKWRRLPLDGEVLKVTYKKS